MTDTLIIGAGAAGIAAGRILHDAGERVLLLEARNRIGGRIYTDFDFASFPIELGAEFIHGENAVTNRLVEAAGLHKITTPRYANLRWATGGPVLPLDQLPVDLHTLLTNLNTAYHNLEQAPLPIDLSLADYLRQSGFDEQAIAIADVRFAQTCCASIETLSCADLQRELRADHAGLEEFKIREGYQPLLDWLCRGLEIRLDTPVHMVRWSQSGVVVETPSQRFSARGCIITVPVSVLQNGFIRFDPPLSVEKQSAIQALRMEPGTKLLYCFDRPLWEDDLLFFCHSGLLARWWIPGFGRADSTVACAFVTADRARQIDTLPETKALALGLHELSQLLGNVDLDAHLVKAKRQSWAEDRWAGGAYAHVPPGAADARVVLAQPEGDVLFFAGEATAFASNPQTVHGAIESGWRAAQEKSKVVFS